MRYHALSALVIAVMMTLAGCQTAKEPYAASPDPVAPVMYPQVAAEGRLGDYLLFSKPSVRHGDPAHGVPMKVTVPLRLKDDKPVNAQYRFIFLDANGVSVGEPMDWRFMVLPPRLQVFMEGAATDSRAIDWRLEIRPAK